MTNRATLFIDGNNWYHGLKRIDVGSYDLDYRRVARKLVLAREVREIRYYVGRVSGDLSMARAQRRFLKALNDQGVQTFLGRIEKNRMVPERNPVFNELKRALAESRAEIPDPIFDRLDSLLRQSVPYYVEKQVDVRIAVDLVGQAWRDEYDSAYLLSADGDFVPAVREARSLGKKVFAASPIEGRQLRRCGRRLHSSSRVVSSSTHTGSVTSRSARELANRRGLRYQGHASVRKD